MATYFITLPGMKKEPVTMSDTATLDTFCAKVFDQTGVRIFQGFGNGGQSGRSYQVAKLSSIINATIYDGITSGTDINFTNYLLPVPPQPTVTITSGTLGAGTYYVKTTYVNPIGETLPSTESTATVLSGSGGLIVASPTAPGGDATGYNVYIGGTGAEHLQNASPVAIGTNYTQSVALLTATVVPSSNTANSPVLHNTLVSSLGISTGDELVVFNVPLGG